MLRQLLESWREERHTWVSQDLNFGSDEFQGCRLINSAIDI